MSPRNLGGNRHVLNEERRSMRDDVIPIQRTTRTPDLSLRCIKPHVNIFRNPGIATTMMPLSMPSFHRPTPFHSP